MRLCSQWHLPPNLKSNGSIILMLIVTRSGKVEQINLKEIIKSENHDIYWSAQLIPAKTAQYKMWNNNHLAFSNYRIRLIQGTGTILARIIGLILSDAKHLIWGKISWFIFRTPMSILSRYNTYIEIMKFKQVGLHYDIYVITTTV